MKHISTRKLVVQRESIRRLDRVTLKHVAGASGQQSVCDRPCGTSHVTKDPSDEQ